MAIVVTPLGAEQTKTATVLTNTRPISDFPNGCTVIVCVASDTAVTNCNLYSVSRATQFRVKTTPDVVINNSGNVILQLFYFENVITSEIGTTNVYIRTSQTAQAVCHISYAVVGLLSSSAFDKSSVGTGTGTSPSSGATQALTQADELIIGVIGIEDNVEDIAGSWTTGTSNVSGNEQQVGTSGGGGASNIVIRTAAEVVSATTAQTAAITSTAGGDWAALVATFKMNYLPTVALNTPTDGEDVTDTTPSLTFTGTDSEVQELEYQIQVDTSNTFNSQPSYFYVGSEAVDGGGSVSVSGYSRVALGNPVVLAGILTDVDIYASNSLTGVKIGAFYEGGSAGTYICSSFVSLGNVGAGFSTISNLNLSVSAGELIGIYGTAGMLDAVNGTGIDSYYCIGDATDGASYTYTRLNNFQLSLRGFVVAANSAPIINDYSDIETSLFTSGSDVHPFTSGSAVTYTSGSTLTSGSTYYWHVRGHDGIAWGDWSSTRSFDVTSGSGASIWITPTDVSVVTSRINPTVQLGSISNTPAVLSAVCATVNPTVLCDLSVAPPAVTSSTSIAVQNITLGLLLTPAPSSLVTGVVVPDVRLGSILLSNRISLSKTSSVNPTVVLFGSAAVSPVGRDAGADSIIGAKFVQPLIIDNESGNAEDYYDAYTGAISLTSGAALASTNFGLNVPVYSSFTYFQKQNITGLSGKLRTRFYINPNDYTENWTGNYATILQGKYSTYVVFKIDLYQLVDRSGYYLKYYAGRDNGSVTSVTSGSFAGEHYVELYLKAATTTESNNGTLEAWLDGGDYKIISALDNKTVVNNLSFINIGFVGDTSSLKEGTIFLDEWVIRFDDQQIGPKDMSIISPLPASARTSVVIDPSVNPASRAAVASVVNPTVQIGLASVVVEPSPSSAIASAIAPTIPVNDITIEPSALSAASSAINPQVAQGSILLATLAPSSSSIHSLNPIVSTGSLLLPLTPLEAASAAVYSGVIVGSLVIAPVAAVSSTASAIANVVFGSLSLALAVRQISTVSVIETAILGSLTWTDLQSYAVATSINPSVSIDTGSVSVTPSAVASSAVSLSPQSIYGSSLVAPQPVLAATQSLCQAVQYGPLSIVPISTSLSAGSMLEVVSLGSLSVVVVPLDVKAETTQALVIQSSLVLVLGLAEAHTSAFATVETGHLSITSSAAYSLCQVSNPTVVQSGLSLSLVYAGASVVSQLPLVSMGSIDIAVQALSSATQSVLPSLVLGSLSFAPSAVIVSTSIINPFSYYGSTVVSDRIAIAGTLSVNPYIPTGSFVCTPGPVIVGSVSINPQTYAGNQFCRPTSDSGNSGWLNELGLSTNLYESINETTPSDTDYVTTPISVLEAHTLTENLQVIEDPEVHALHKMRFRYKIVGSVDNGFYVQLSQAGVGTIATWSISTANQDYETVEVELTEGQAASITDYSALQVSFYNGTQP